MLITTSFMGMVHVTLAQTVGVALVLNRGMATIGTVGMIGMSTVIVSFVIIGHGWLFVLLFRYVSAPAD